ncbi:hypothetical protein SLA2020_428640 [Shorea laevis]
MLRTQRSVDSRCRCVRSTRLRDGQVEVGEATTRMQMTTMGSAEANDNNGEVRLWAELTAEDKNGNIDTRYVHIVVE